MFRLCVWVGGETEPIPAHGKHERENRNPNTGNTENASNKIIPWRLSLSISINISFSISISISKSTIIGIAIAVELFMASDIPIRIPMTISMIIVNIKT